MERLGTLVITKKTSRAMVLRNPSTFGAFFPLFSRSSISTSGDVWYSGAGSTGSDEHILLVAGHAGPKMDGSPSKEWLPACVGSPSD